MTDTPKEIRRIRELFVLVIILGFAYVAVRPTEQEPFSKVHMLNVGQGDSFLIQAANGIQVLIDGGRDEKVLTELASLMPRGDRSIDVVIATHPDNDHIGGLPLVLDRYKIGMFLTSEVITDTETFTDLYKELQKRNVPSYYMRSGMTLTLDPVLLTKFSILFPNRDTSRWETNAASVIGELTVGERSILFTGDSPSAIEQSLVKEYGSVLDTDILKVGHHGSKTSSSEVFLRATTPALALISAGVNNRYGHPAPEVVNRLKTLGIPYVSTQDSGTVTIETDGVKWFKSKK